MTAPPLHVAPPAGIYFAREAGRLAGVSGDRIGQWARRGYIRPSHGHGPPNMYAYQDVAEAMVVHQLLLLSASLDQIRTAIKNLRETGGNWPLSKTDLWVDPSTGLIAEREGDSFFEVSSKKMVGQGLSEHAISLRSVAHDLSRGGWAARQLPDLEYIEVDPNRLSGTPTIRGRRVEAELVAEIAEEPNGRQRLKREYDVDPAEVDDAVRWWREVQTYEAA